MVDYQNVNQYLTN